MSRLRLSLVLLLITGANGFLFWVVFASGPIRSVLATAACALPFGIAALGTYWMLYDCVRHERKPAGYVALAFVPYAFVWYYFDRSRPRVRPRRAPFRRGDVNSLGDQGRTRADAR